MTVLAAFSFVLVYAVKAFVMIIPAPALYIAAGIAFPAGWAVIITYIGLTVGASITYYNGKRLGRGKIDGMIAKNRRIASFLDKEKANLLSLCFVARLLPLPKDLGGMFFGAAGMPFAKYLIITLLGLSPVMIPHVITGSFITIPPTVEMLVPFGISLSITLIAFAIYWTILKKRKLAVV